MDKKTFKNFMYNLAYQVLVILAPLVTTPYVSRVLHPDGIGTFSYTAAIATAFALFAALGVNSYGQREIAYRQEDSHAASTVFWELMVLRTVMTLVVTAVYVAFSFVYAEYTGYLLIQVGIVLATLLDISWFYQGMEMFKPIALRNAAVRLATIALIFLLVRTEQDLWIYMLINAASTFLGNALFFIKLPQLVTRVTWAELNVARHVRGTIEFFIPLIAVQLYSQLDRVMLGALGADAAENGYYEQARKIVFMVITVVSSLNTVLYSRVSHLVAQDDKQLIERQYSWSFKVNMLLLLPMAVGLFLIADNFTAWFFGPGFQKVALLLKLSCPLILFMGIGNFIGLQYLAPTGQQNKMTAAYLVAAAVNIALNLILISWLLSVGALLASAAAELVSCAIQIVLLKRSKFDVRLTDGLWKYLFASAVMGTALLGLQLLGVVSGPVQTLVEIALGVVAYGVVLLATREEMLGMLLGAAYRKLRK